MVERRIGRPADPLATYGRLRDQGILGQHAYLHVSPDRAEVGWAPRLALRLDAGTCAGWRESVRRIARQAAETGGRAFGYLPFDLADRDAACTVPDRSAPLEVRGELIVPSERVTFTASEVVHTTTSGFDIEPYLGDREAAPLPPSVPELVPASERTEAEFLEAVRAAVEAIRGGELERVTLSRHRAHDVRYDPVVLFRALCAPGNFADAYLLELGPVRAVIASPELLLDTSGGIVSTVPLVGTRPRGVTPAEDARLGQELLADRKERDEHALCVRRMVEELESSGCVDAISWPERPTLFHLLRLQHLGSLLTARLIPGADVVDVLASLFPAVTVTGSPRATALSLLRRLEAGPRGLYAGAVGWISGQRECRLSVAIRGAFQYGDRVFVHAGAGITSASDPAAEARESTMKLLTVEQALQRAALR